MALKKFYLDRREGKFMGVCSGIANYFRVDVTFVRVGVVLATLLGGFPWTLVAYLVAGWVAKPEPALGYEADDIRMPRTSTKDLRLNMRDIDRRMAEVEQYVTSSNSSLASEIDSLR